ncbi:diguanylate cyclase [Chelatococcus sambhunathii]|uniref:diguanylate cyclase n=1 Tax=Chelatococcus sambhunathii TaxID=363953 RepID=A0ABU1DBL1_9HYPH|nr:diguanylate cyclase [Chelatococcus sambhunathii]MDR4305502.1 diguanylate cyclase [Chelatococcus sambhunathii]
MKIVIVDPSRVVQKILSGTLENAGHEVVCLSDGLLALEHLRDDDRVDVLVTSLQPRGLSGLDLVRRARGLCGSRRALYVLVMSSSSERSVLVEALDSGADDFIGKPPAEEELLARMRVAKRVAGLQRELIRLATIDSMTGVFNRRAFFELSALAVRSATDAVAIFDIDRFKHINDTFGHAAGDEAIIAVTRAAAARCLRIGRLGGEEFGMLMPGADLAQAVALCDAIRLDVEKLTFEAISPGLRITCSFGVSEWRPNESIDEALKRADVALYAAKAAGRNRVEAEIEIGAQAASDAASLDGVRTRSVRHATR